MDIEKKLDMINKDMSKILKYYDWSKVCLKIMVGMIFLMMLNLTMLLLTIMFDLEWFTHRQLLNFNRSVLIVHLGNAIIHQILSFKYRRGFKRIEEEYKPFIKELGKVVKEHGKKED